MDEIKRPLIPQFSLRWILVATAVLAVVSLVASEGLRGAAWAGGVTVGLAALVLTFFVYALLYLVATLMARGAALRQSHHRPQKSDESTSPTTKRTTAALIMALALTATDASSAWAASGGAITYPVLGPKQTNKTGLTLTVNTSWVHCYGYRPVTFELKSITGPLKADRVFRVHFRAGAWRFDGNSTVVTQTIEIPEGATSAKAVVSVPTRQPWTTFDWEVFEDGSHVRQLSSEGQIYIPSGNPNLFGDGAPPTILALSGQGQISPNNLTVYGQNEDPVIFVGPALGPATPITVMGTARTPVTVTMTAPTLPTLANLPTRWIDYSGIDIILTSLTELQLLITKHPATWQAIQTWVKGGGALVVYGVGDKWEQLEELELLTDTSEEPDLHPSTDIEARRVERGWLLPRSDIRDLPLNGVTNYNTPASTSIPANATETSTASLTMSNSPFLIRPYGHGMIAAISSDDKFKGDAFSWTWLYNTLSMDHWQWFQRYGVSLTRENNDFWNFLIPGVGAAPVNMFQVLITLFVVAIGPLNYYLLSRIGKLNLMVLSVPLCAAVITLGLFIFSLVADGLQVRLRARSLTCLDQRSGQSQCFARLSYYAGLPPRGGLVFSDETIVLPMQPEALDFRGGSPRAVDWERINRSQVDSPLRQRLTSGWLKSRTPTQFVTVRLGSSKAQLVVEQSEAEEIPRVTNELGVPIEQLVLIDRNGKCYTATELASGQSIGLVKAESQGAAAMQSIEPLMNQNDPQTQSQLIADYNQQYWSLGRSRWYGGWYNNSSSVDAQQSTGVMERSIRDLRKRLSEDKLPPQSYLAIVSTSPEMETGTETEEEASFHLVFGRW